MPSPVCCSAATSRPNGYISRLRVWDLISLPWKDVVTWSCFGIPSARHILDELAVRLLDAVRRRGVKRLVIDGLSGFQQAAVEPGRIVRFWSALSHELRALGVTAMHTIEMPDLIGAELRLPLGGIASLAEVMIVLRYVELRSCLLRLVSLFKVREGAFDPTIREFKITNSGIIVGQPFEGTQAILSGHGTRIVANGDDDTSGDDTARSG